MEKTGSNPLVFIEFVTYTSMTARKIIKVGVEFSQTEKGLKRWLIEKN